MVLEKKLCITFLVVGILLNVIGYLVGNDMINASGVGLCIPAIIALWVMRHEH